MAGRKGMRDYPAETKLEAVRRFLEEGETHAQTSKALGIQGTHCVERWIREYRREGESAFCRRRGRPRKAQDEKAHIAQLEMEVKLLKKFHTELRNMGLAKRNIGSSVIIKKNSQ
jgi:transposase-like protein